MTVVIFAFEKLYDFDQGKYHTIDATKIEESISVDDIEMEKARNPISFS